MVRSENWVYSFLYDPAVYSSTEGEEAVEKDFQYWSMIGSLLYISIHTSPDIAVERRMLAGHMDSPQMKHQQAAVKVMKYLKTTSKLGIIFNWKSTLSELKKLSGVINDWRYCGDVCRRSCK